MRRVIGAWALAAAAVASAACAPAKTPAETYLDYHKVAREAKTVDQIMPFLPQEDRDKLAKAPAPAKAKAVEWVLGMRQDMEKLPEGQPKVVKEDVQGDTATLEVECVIDYSKLHNPHLGQKPAGADVKLVKEKDGWKVVAATNWMMK
jgi:hypothetical protein